MYFFIFGIFPYIALSIFLLGSLYRYHYAPMTWKAPSTQLLRTRTLFWGSLFCHIGMVVFLFAHVFGMLTPHHLYEMFGLTTELKQKIEIVVGTILCPTTLLGLGLLIWRHIRDPRIKSITLKAELLLLIVLWIQVLIGFSTVPVSAQHLDGSMMLTLTGWVQGVFVFRTDNYQALVNVPWQYQLHIFLGMWICLLVPFTRLIHLLSGVVLVEYLMRPYQIVSSRHSTSSPS
jgi:nitrate reductase gamma subunit